MRKHHNSIHDYDCRICMRPLDTHQSIFEYFFHQDLICHDCRAQFYSCNQTYHSPNGFIVHALYNYHDALEDLLYRYKEHHDIALADVFCYRYAKSLRKRYRGYTLIPMPSSYEKIQERGFQHLIKMAEVIGLPICDCLEKTCNHKQSLQDATHRQNISKYIKLKEDVKLPDTPLLLFDDVVTTGATLSAAYQLLAMHALEIEAVVCAIHPLFVDRCVKKD